MLKGVLSVLCAVCIWSGWVVMSRFAVKDVLTPYDITAIRFTVAGILLLPILYKYGIAIGGHDAPLMIRRMRGILLAGLMGAPYTTISVMGMLYAPASHASTVNTGTFFLSSTIAGILFLKESTSWLRLMGVLVCVTGIGCMLVAQSDDRSVFPHMALGHLLFVISGVMWAMYTILIRRWNPEPLHAASLVAIFSMIGYMPFYVAFIPSHLAWEYWQEILFQAIYQGVITAIVAFIAFNYGVRVLGATRASAFVPLVPALVTLLAIPILHEMPTFIEWIGVIAVSCGVFLASGLITVKKQS